MIIYLWGKNCSDFIHIFCNLFLGANIILLFFFNFFKCFFLWSNIQGFLSFLFLYFFSFCVLFWLLFINRLRLLHQKLYFLFWFDIFFKLAIHKINSWFFSKFIRFFLSNLLHFYFLFDCFDDGLKFWQYRNHMGRIFMIEFLTN